MPKGSSPTNVTQTTVNPAQQAQQPFLTAGWQGAQNLYQNNPMNYYPGETLAPYAPPNPILRQGYGDIYNTGQSVDQSLRPAANQAFTSALGGGTAGAASPAYPYYQQYAAGTAWPQTQSQLYSNMGLQGANRFSGDIGAYAPQAAGYGAQAAGYGDLATGYGNQASGYGSQAVGYGNLATGYGSQAANLGNLAAGYGNLGAGYGAQGAANNNLGLSQLGQTASGAHLLDDPFMAKMVESAMAPVTRNYQTSTAPTTDAAFSMGGRYGSGAFAGPGGAVSSNELNLGKTLSELSGNLYGQQYARERQAQDAAAQQYGQLYNQGLGVGIEGARLGVTGAGQGIQGSLAGIQGAQTGISGAGQGIQGSLAGIQGAQTGISGASAGANAAGTAANIGNAAANQYYAGLNAAQKAAQDYATQQQYGIGGLQRGAETTNQQQLDALRLYPGLAQAQFIAPNATVQAGQGLTSLDQQAQQYQQQAINDQMARYYGEQQAPYKTLQTYLNSIGQPTSGSQSTTTPYYTNQLASTLSGLTGATGLANNLGLFGGGGGGLGGLGGGSAWNSIANAGLTNFGGGGELGLAAATAPAAIDYGALASAGGAGGKSAASALPFLAL